MNFDTEIVYTVNSIKNVSGFLVLAVISWGGIFPPPKDKENVSTKVCPGKLLVESSSFLLFTISYIFHALT